MNLTYKKVILLISCFISLKLYSNSKRKSFLKAFPFTSIIASQHDFKKDLELANKFFKNEEYTKALELALSIIKKSDSYKPELFYKCHYLIGSILRRINNHEKSLLYFKKSLADLNSLKNKYNTEKTIPQYTIKKARNLVRIGAQFLELNKNDSAVYYFKKVISTPSLNQEIQSIKASAHGNLSGTYLIDSVYNKAKEHAYKAIEIHKKSNNKISQATAIANLASIYISQEDYIKAKELYQKALSLIEKDQSIEASKYQEDLYYNLAWTMYLLKDYKAYEYQEKSIDIKDALRDKEVNLIMKGIFEKHKIDLEKQKATTLKNKIELEKQQEKISIYLSSAISLLILIISGVIVYNYKLRQKNLHLKFSQSKLLEEQNIERLKIDAQIKILNATIDGKETERKQIAETLHDSVSALLSSANMHLTATKKQFKEKTPIELEKTQEIILEASQKVRDLSHNLVSSILLKFGLEYAINDIAKKYSNSELSFHTDFTDVNRYNQEFEIKIYNVLHELINNIIKHSKANNAHIVIEDKNGFISFLIEDDGIGFNFKDSKTSSGLGLNQIEARIKMMNGSFLIESAEQRGTKITISVPSQLKHKLSSFS